MNKKLKRLIKNKKNILIVSLLGIILFLCISLFCCYTLFIVGSTSSSLLTINTVIPSSTIVDIPIILPTLETSTVTPVIIKGDYYTKTPELILTLEHTLTPTIIETRTPTYTYTRTPLPTNPPPTPEHPVGTSGRCKDGTYTYANQRRGACSHHDGIAEWWGP